VRENDERRAYALTMVVLVAAILVHVSLGLFFHAFERPTLAAYEAVSTLFFLLLVFLLHRYRLVPLAGALSLLEFAVHSAVMMVALGVSSGFVMIPLVATAISTPVHYAAFPLRLAVATTSTLITLIAAAYSFNIGPTQPFPPDFNQVLLIANAIWLSIAVSFSLWFFLGEMWNAEEAYEMEYERSEGLLRNILPGEVAERLKLGEKTIADLHPQVTVLFADIVGFTERAAKVPPDELVALLNRVFSSFDALAHRHGVEKIKTIGDAYMAVAGLPRGRADHAEAIARLALDMQRACAQIEAKTGEPLPIRVGIHSGPVVAGVIGSTKFAYDLWGDVVNLASRMESNGVPGRVQISEATFALLARRYRCSPRGPIEIKGKGQMEVWFLDGLLDEPAAPRSAPATD